MSDSIYEKDLPAATLAPGTNLRAISGGGDSVQVPASALATADQGVKADTAVQPDDLSEVATSGDFNDLDNKPILGTAAAADVADFDGAGAAVSAAAAAILTHTALDDPHPQYVAADELAGVAFSGSYADLANKPTMDFLPTSALGEANGVTPLGPDRLISSVYLPSYVDDVLEFASLPAFPNPGEKGKIYVAEDTNKNYRWSGSLYIEINPSPGSTDAVPEGSVNLYHTSARAAAAAPVQSINGKTGTPVLVAGDVGAQPASANLTSWAAILPSTKADTATTILDHNAAVGSIPASANLDSYTATGIYHQASNANAASGTNYPTPNAGELIVYAAGPMVYQTYRRYGTALGIYHRNFYNGTWFPWSNEWNSANFDPAGKANVGHGHAISEVAGLQATLANIPTQTGDLLVSKATSIIGIGVSGGRNGGLANYANNGIGDVGIFSEHAGGRVRIRPNGRADGTGELIVYPDRFTWGGQVGYHAANHGSAGDPHPQYATKGDGSRSGFLRSDGTYTNELENNGDQRFTMRAASETLVPNFTGNRARGTLSSPTALASTDTMMLFVAGGWNGSEYKVSARVRMRAEEAYTASASGSGILFEATPIGTNAAVVRMRIDGLGHILPGADNTQNVGSASARPKEVFAGANAINTSDGRHKTLVRVFTPGEIAAAVALGAELGIYQWLDAVADKGEDAARLHPGLTVQRAIEVMQGHGLDPMRYGFICYDQWPELPEIRNCWPLQPRVVDDFGDLVREQVDAGVEIVQEYRAAGDLYSFRMSPLLAFIAAGERAARQQAQREHWARMDNLEERLAAAGL